MVATIDEKLTSALANAVEMLQEPEMGSDQYLDKVSRYRDRFDNLADLVEMIVDDVLVSNNRGEDVQVLIPRLKKFHVSYIEAIDSYTRSIYGRGLKTALERAKVEARQVREFIDDCTINAERIKANKELQDLFSQL